MILFQQVKENIIHFYIPIIFLKQTMKQPINEYYASTSEGYVKYQNVEIINPPLLKEIPVSSRCNQILPYKYHKIEVKQPIKTFQLKQTQKGRYQRDQTKQKDLNYSFSSAYVKNPKKVIQQEQVHSIHIEDKLSARTNACQKARDLTQSVYSNLKTIKNDMKRSLFSSNNSNCHTDITFKQNSKMQNIISELMNQKQKRRSIEEKYQILFKMINKTTGIKSATSDIQQDKRQDNLQQSQHQPLKNKKKGKRTYYLKSDTQQSSQEQIQSPIIINYRKRVQRKKRGSQPIIIQLNLQQPQRNQKTQQDKQSKRQNVEQIKNSIQQLRNQVSNLQQNVEYLQNRIQEQEVRHQKQLLINQLRQKQRKIQNVSQENQRIKQINQMFFCENIKIKSEAQQIQIFGAKIKRDNFIFSFIIGFLTILLILNLKNTVC